MTPLPAWLLPSVFGDLKCHPTTPFLKSLLSRPARFRNFFLQKLYLPIISFYCRVWVGIGTLTSHCSRSWLSSSPTTRWWNSISTNLSPVSSELYVHKPLSPIRMYKSVSSVACLTDTAWYPHYSESIEVILHIPLNFKLHYPHLPSRWTVIFSADRERANLQDWCEE